MKFSKILTLLVILMAGIAFSGCVGNSGNDQNATVEETIPTASEDSANVTENPNDLEKAAVNKSETTTASEMSGVMGGNKKLLDKIRNSEFQE